MRRLPVLGAVLLLVAVGGPAASGASTTNTTMTATVAQATWSSLDPNTGMGEFAALEFARADGATTASFFRSVGEVVLCEGADTPADPTDDVFGFVGTEVNGSGPGTMSLGRQYTSAKASATVTAEVVTYDECSGDFGTTTTTTYKVSLTLTAISPLIRQQSRTTLRVPGELSAHAVIRGVFRQAAGTAKVGARTVAADGAIGQLTLREHETSR